MEYHQNNEKERKLLVIIAIANDCFALPHFPKEKLTQLIIYFWETARIRNKDYQILIDDSIISLPKSLWAMI